MELKLHIDPAAEAITVTVTAPAETEEVKALLALLSPYAPIPGYQGERVIPLDPARIARFYTQEKGVFAQDTAGETYAVKLRLYELEERLDGRVFVRASNSELVNLRHVTALDLSLSGAIKLTLVGGGVCWVSRRNVKNIKKALGL